MNEAQVKEHVAVIEKFVFEASRGRDNIDKRPVIASGMALFTGLLVNISQIADAQQRIANLLEADATPQTLIKVEERKG